VYKRQVFCRTRRETQALADILIENGYNAEALHGDLSQDKRDQVMNRFRKKICPVLVCTDVAARGIDVDDLTHVVHLSLPDDRAYYTHRAGRTARGGKEGISLAIITTSELTYLRSLEKGLNIKIEKALVPTGDEIAQARLQIWINQVFEQNPMKDHTLNQALIEAFEPLSKEDIVTKMAALSVEKFNLKAAQKDINVSEQSIRKERGQRGDRGGLSRREGRRSGGDRDRGDRGRGKRSNNGDYIFINVGSKDGLNVPQLLQLIHKKTGFNQRQLGDIRLRGNHSLVEISQANAGKFINKLHGTTFKGRNMVAKKDEK